MSDAKQISETEAINRILAEGNVMDYVDVVEAVREKFGISVSSALVEKVHLDRSSKRQRMSDREIKLQLSGSPLKNPSGVCNPSTEHLGHALKYVKAVGGLDQAKKVLDELESTLRDLN